MISLCIISGIRVISGIGISECLMERVLESSLYECGYSCVTSDCMYICEFKYTSLQSISSGVLDGSW